MPQKLTAQEFLKMNERLLEENSVVCGVGNGILLLVFDELKIEMKPETQKTVLNFVDQMNSKGH